MRGATKVSLQFQQNCACHAKWISGLIRITYETFLIMREETLVTVQLHHMLRLPRKPHSTFTTYCACHEKCTLPLSALFSWHLFSLGIYSLLASILSWHLSLLASILSWHLFSLGIFSLSASFLSRHLFSLGIFSLSASIPCWDLFSFGIFSLGIYFRWFFKAS